jgi:1-acyl-sn-glycerol-3-phosphate acyltransferase
VPAQAVIVIYPHTSNWDFPVGLLTKWIIALPIQWLAKDSLFASPLGPWFRRLGGIPVNRNARSGVIGQLVERFRADEPLRLVIAPEGTRSRTVHWKSGFYHLARAANVPVGLGFIDYGRREVGIGAWIALSGNATVDMARIAAFYRDKVARRPAQAGGVSLAPPGPPGLAPTAGDQPERVSQGAAAHDLVDGARDASRAP